MRGDSVNNANQKEREKIIVDPFGSDTGRTVDADEKPVQDADDL